MDNSGDPIRDLGIIVGGDISPLEDALAQIPEAVNRAAADFSEFEAGANMLDAVTGSANQAAQAISGLGASVGTSAAALDSTSSGLSNVGSAAQSLNAPLQQISATFATLQANLLQAQQHLQLVNQAFNQGLAGAGQVQTAAQQLQQAFAALNGTTQTLSQSTGGLVNALAGLFILHEVSSLFEDFVSGALKAYSEVQALTLSFTLLSGSAEQAASVLHDIQQIAATQPFGFPELAAAAQKLEAFGVDAAKIPSLLLAASDAAAATGNSFSAIANTLARVAETGTITARQFVQLGVNMQDVADYLGVSLTQATADLKKGVLDAETAVDLLSAVVQQKFGGAAGTLSATIENQFKILQNQIHGVLASIGEDLAPFAQKMIDAFQSIIPTIKTAVESFNSIPEPLRSVIATLGELLIIAPAVALAVGTLATAFGALATFGWPVIAIVGALGLGLAAINFPELGASVQEFGFSIKTLWDQLSGAKGATAEFLASASGLNEALRQNVPIYAQISDAIRAFDSWLLKTALDTFNLKGALTDFNSIVSWFSGNYKSMVDSAVVQNSRLGPSFDTVAQAATAQGAAMDRASLQARVAADVASAAADAAAKAAAKWNTSWDASANKAITDFVMLQDATGDTEGAISKLNSVLLSGQSNWDKMSASSKQAYADVQKFLQLALSDQAQAAQTAAVDKLDDEVTKLSNDAGLALAKVPADFTAAMQMAANGQNFTGLENQIQSQINKIQQMISTVNTANRTEGQALVAQDAINVGQAAIDKLTAVKGQLQDIKGALGLLGQDTSMAKLGAEVQGFVEQASAGKLTSDQISLSLDNLGTDLIKKVIPALQAGGTVAPEFARQLQSLDAVVPGLGTDLVTAAKQGVQPFTDAVLDWQAKIPPTIAQVNAAFQSLGAVSLQQAQNNVKAYGNDVVISLSSVNTKLQQGTPEWNAAAADIAGWASKTIPLLQQFGGQISDDVIAKIALISPAVAAAAASGDWDKLQQAVKTFTQNWKDGIASAQEAFATFGLKSVDVLTDLEAHQRSMLAILQAQGAPLGQQLTAEQAILETQIKIGETTGQNSDAQLALTEQLVASRLQSEAFRDSTSAISKLYLDLDNAFGKTWDDFGKGIGDAIVSGQDFGKVFTDVFNELKKQVAELVTQSLLGQLKDAILQNTGFLQDYNKIFNALFGGGGSTGLVQAGLANAQQAITVTFDEMGQATKVVQDTVQAAQKTTTAALSQVSQAASTAATNLLGLLGNIGDIVSAIAGLFSAIELAHTNTLLDRIANNTLGMLNVLGTNGDDSILGATRGTWQQMQSLVALMWNPVVTLENKISGNLDDINLHTQTIAILMAQGGFGGDVSGSSGSTIIQMLAEEIQVATENLTNVANSINSAGTVLTNGSNNLSYASSQVIVSTGSLSDSANNLAVASSNLQLSTDATVTAANSLAIALGTSGASTPAIAPVIPQGAGFSIGNVVITPVGSYSGSVGGTVVPGGAGGVTLNVTVQAGTVVGQNGMGQLADMVGNDIVTKLRRNASLIKA